MICMGEGKGPSGEMELGEGQCCGEPGQMHSSAFLQLAQVIQSPLQSHSQTL